MTTNLQHYHTLFQLQAPELAGANTAWMLPWRESALEAFSAQGFPGHHSEDWKYTSLKSLSHTNYTLSAPSGLSEAKKLLAQTTLSASNGSLLVFVDGYFSRALSLIENLPQGVILTSLSQALLEHEEKVKKCLGSSFDMSLHPLAALNSAFMLDGLFLWVPEGVILDKPIQCAFLSACEEQCTMSHARHVIHLGAHAKASVLEYSAGLNGVQYFNNTLTEAFLMPGASLQHDHVQNQSSESVHIGALYVHQDKDSHFESFTLAAGAALSRQDIHVKLQAEGAVCALQGLYMANEKQHTDIHTRIDHKKPHCASSEFYKGILDDAAKGVFNGKVIVHPGAGNTTSHQANKNLLLSSQAEVNTKPELEIYADDVKCTHGATVGELDENMLFYLRSRGIPEVEARALLIKAFANDILKKVDIDCLGSHLFDLVSAKLGSKSEVAV